ncbi:copper resistance protein CopC [Streptomyces sp. NPDC048279]|uniref:copper resistance protein CopC n=1 Tax=Streptomyces sp. NPDC048279 TaxID=3154714 RepID=UPI00342C7DA4
MRALALLGSLLTALLLASAAPASAHAALRGSDPADGAVLKSSPGSVTLTFTESVGLLADSFRVYDPTNHRVTTGDAEHGPAGADTARITFPKKLATGTFTVAWRVVSADSHPVSGALTFSVGKPSATTAAVPTGPAENPATGSLYDIGRYVAYLAVALLTGGVAFMALCRPPDTAPLRRPVRTAWWTLLAATLFLFVLRSPYEEGTSPATALDLAALGRTATGRPGLVLLARVALLAITAGLYAFLVRGREHRLRPPSRPFLVTAAVLAVALALTWATAEHASAGIQVPLAMTSSVLHLLAMSLWLGGLTALLTTLHRATATPLPAAVVTRFSRVAFASVTVLVVTGVYQSWRGLGSWQALTDTTYGRLLLVKLAAVTLLLAAAAGNPAKVLAKAVRKDFAKVTGLLETAMAEPPGHDRDLGLHDARKKAKRTRYAAEAARPALGGPAKSLVKSMKSLQSLLGEHQDSVMARQTLRELSAVAHAAGESAFTYGLLYGREEPRAAAVEARTPGAWQEIKEDAPV